MNRDLCKARTGHSRIVAVPASRATLARFAGCGTPPSHFPALKTARSLPFDRERSLASDLARLAHRSAAQRIRAGTSRRAKHSCRARRTAARSSPRRNLDTNEFTARGGSGAGLRDSHLALGRAIEPVADSNGSWESPRDGLDEAVRPIRGHRFWHSHIAPDQVV